MKYPQPVERDVLKNQVEIKSDTRRLRKTPSLKGTAYDEYCKRGIYNVYDWKTADGYDWALIDTIDGNTFWVAVMAGEDLPVLDYKELYEKEKARADKLDVELLKLEDEFDQVSKALIDANRKLEEIKKDVERWAL